MQLTVEVTEPAVMIRINQMYSSSLSTLALYEATRGVWVIGERRNNVTYALAVSNGVVREVYAIHSWHRAGTTEYTTRTKEDVDHEGRWEFLGEVAPSAIRNKYLNRSVAHYFRRGAANPITYVNA
jgi:hypothetical protein